MTIDLDIVEANIKRAQERLDGFGIANRPHIKTHKLPHMAKLQMDAGAVGITCQKLGEAEVFADAGVADDILLTFNILGVSKTDRLCALVKRLKRMAVVLDNETVARGLSEAGVRNGVDIRFLIECDTGFGRNGVQSPQAALDLAQTVMKMPRMQFEGPDDVPDQGAGDEAISGADAAIVRRGRDPGAGRVRRRLAGDETRRRVSDADRVSRRHLHL